MDRLDEKFQFSESKIITLESSRNSKLLLQTNDEENKGTVNWQSKEGLMLGSEYIIPPLPGSLIISNHKLDSTQIDIQGASFSIQLMGCIN